MIAMWMLRQLLATALIALAARTADEAARGLDWPRRWPWAGAFVLAASLPWLGGLLPVPSLTEALLDRLAPALGATPVVPSGATARTTPASTAPPWTLMDGAPLGGWMLASLALAFVFARAFWRMRIARRHADRADPIDGVEVIRSRGLGPAVAGIVHPAIILPRWADELPEAERSLILSHEREHATARDPLLLAGATLMVVAAPWCLPLWWMHRRLRDASETDCDARVVARGADRLVYGRALLRAAGRPSGAAFRFATPLLGGAAVSRLEQRILMMTQQRPKHPVLRAVPLIAVATLAAVIACDAADPRSQTPTPLEPEAAAAEVKLEIVRTDTLLVLGVVRDAQQRGRDEPAFDSPATPPPVYYIDGERVEDGASALDELDPAMIETIEVFKGKALELYPPGHAGGVIRIVTKKR